MSNAAANESGAVTSPQAGAELMPPADLELVPPAPVAAVPLESASGRVRLKPDVVADLDAQVRAFVDQITQVDSQDPRFKDAVDRIHSMGNRDIAQSASVSNRLLDQPVASMNGLFDSGSDISRS